MRSKMVCIKYVVWEASVDAVSNLGVNREKEGPMRPRKTHDIQLNLKQQ